MRPIRAPNKNAVCCPESPGRAQADSHFCVALVVEPPTTLALPQLLRLDAALARPITASASGTGILWLVTAAQVPLACLEAIICLIK